MNQNVTCACGRVIALPAGATAMSCPTCGQSISATGPAGSLAPGKGLAVTALVLACLICVPLLPLVGLVLGIVALVKARSHPGAPGKGLAIAAIVVAAVGLVPGLGIQAAVAIPAFISYIREAKLAEVRGNLDQISRSVELYHGEHGSLPPSAPLTPPERCALSPDGRCQVRSELWTAPGWQALGFSIGGPHYYQYELVTDGTSFTARAHGDLDGDSVLSTFERSGGLDASGALTLSRGTWENLRTE